MPFRERVKRFGDRGKQALGSLGWPVPSTIPLPDTGTGPTNTGPAPTSSVGGTEPPTYSPSPSPSTKLASPSRVGLDKNHIQGTKLSLGAPATSSSIGVNHSLNTGQEASTQPPSPMVGGEVTSSSTDPPKFLGETQDDLTEPTFTTLQTTSPALPVFEALFESKDNLTQPALLLHNPQGVPSVDNQVLQSASNLPPSSSAFERVSTHLDTTPAPGDDAWRCLRGFWRVLDGISEGFGPLKSVIDELGRFIETHEDAARARQDYVALKFELEQLFSTLSGHFAGNAPPIMTMSINNLCTAVENELNLVSTKEERRMGSRHLEASKDLDEVMKCYRRIQGHLERLKLNVDLNMWKVVDEQASESRLRSLVPSMSACYNSAESQQVGRRECTPETRKKVLTDLSHWRHDKSQENMYWLNGMAGTGKTTIASSLCAMLDKSHELGASFFCTRLLPECRNVKSILPTIAYQLARFSRPFYYALSSALQEEPDLHTKIFTSQLDGLIAGPLRKVAPTLPADIVVVIDALDECDDSQGVGMLIEIFAGCVANLPIKLFVSSRPEPQIRHNIGDAKLQLVLHELEHSIVKEDIRLYLRTELQGLATPISDADLAILVEQAGVLFIYAATVVRYIKSTTQAPLQRKRIQALFGVAKSGASDKHRAIDALYSTILAAAFDFPDFEADDKVMMKLVLDTVVCAQEPLTSSSLAVLLGLEDSAWVRAVIEPLWSVLHVYDADGVVTTLHASFPDYMFDLTRSRGYGCQAEKHHGRLAGLCFDRIKGNIQQFNICGLKSSFVPDDQVTDLEQRVQQMIPQDLSYACRYWAAHLGLGEPSAERLAQLNDFLSKRLLLWMEVLNLKKQMNFGVLMIETARVWCQRETTYHSTKDLLHDVWRFVTMFATNDVSRSTPHLYSSMLASWPSSGPVAVHYTRRTLRLAKVGGTGMTRRQLALLGTWASGASPSSVSFSPDGRRIVSSSMLNNRGLVHVWDAASGKAAMSPIEHTNGVISVAFSPDGMRIVASSFDCMIHAWSAKNGELAMEPLQGHTDTVDSIAFSPDGTRIVSGSQDKTLRIWDTTNGKLAMGPLRGHTGRVISVAFSPDGRRIASGSADATIRVWDTASGKMIMSPLKGHNSFVTSVAFSPNNVSIASGSLDYSVRVWDMTTGEEAVGPLTGHTGSVRSIVFSPDGMWIASASDDCTIRVWAIASGDLAMEPLQGHTAAIKSVAFSPDGARIASISDDGTIRVWDPMSEKPTSGPLEGHSDWVNSVAFSPDGMRIASGSNDKTICVWDAIRGNSMIAPLTGHTQGVLSIAFSPSGTHIASGSSDHTIRIWNSMTGKLAMDPIQGHTDSVTSVAFSPDGTRIVSGSRDHSIRVWDARRGTLAAAPLEGHSQRVTAVAYSPDGSRIVSSSHDGTIRVWDTATGKPAMNLFLSTPRLNYGDIQKSMTSQPHLNPYFSSTSVSKGSRRYLKHLGAISGSTTAKEAQIPKPPFVDAGIDAVLAVTFSPNGKRIVSGSKRSSRVSLWDAKRGQLLVKSEGYGHDREASVCPVSSSPDDMFIASGVGHKIGIWDTRNDQLALTAALGGHTDLVSSLSFSPNGTRIASGSYDNTIRIWDLGTLPGKLDNSDNSSWSLNDHGWIVDGYQRLLLWLPPNLRDRILTRRNPCLISTEGSIELDFGNANIGESWTECYTPAM